MKNLLKSVIFAGILTTLAFAVSISVYAKTSTGQTTISPSIIKTQSHEKTETKKQENSETNKINLQKQKTCFSQKVTDARKEKNAKLKESADAYKAKIAGAKDKNIKATAREEYKNTNKQITQTYTDAVKSAKNSCIISSTPSATTKSPASK